MIGNNYQPKLIGPYKTIKYIKSDALNPSVANSKLVLT